jgi:hypothetical protein
MDRFTPALAVTSAVFFWLPAVVVLMVTGLFPVLGYSFGLVFLVLGIISSAGFAGTLYGLWRTSGHWYPGLPLALTLIIGTACALLAVILMPSHTPPDDFSGIVGNLGQTALLCLAPSAFLFFIGFLLGGQERELLMGAVGISVIVSIISAAMLTDMVFLALKISDQAVFTHPLWEGMIILYGLGTMILGIMVLVIAGRCPSGQPVFAYGLFI